MRICSAKDSLEPRLRHAEPKYPLTAQAIPAAATACFPASEHVMRGSLPCRAPRTRWPACPPYLNMSEDRADVVSDIEQESAVPLNPTDMDFWEGLDQRIYFPGKHMAF